MTATENNEPFVQHITQVQRSLYAYILTLTTDPAAANDILQETNLELWRHRERFEQGTDFGAWAARIAYFKVLTHRKSLKRDRLCFNDSLLETLATEAEGELAATTATGEALENCVRRLSADDRILLDKRYAANLPPRAIASDLQRSARSISQSLYRIRVALLRCIDYALAAEKS
jgi:RNA polymerase sigma-70 factor (ECF subfamily)